MHEFFATKDQSTRGTTILEGVWGPVVTAGSMCVSTFPQVLKGQIDFKSEPWPKISDAAKDCVKRLLEMDTSKRATSEQVGGVLLSSCAGAGDARW